MTFLTWSEGKILDAISDIVTRKECSWIQETGKSGTWFCKSGKSAVYSTEGVYGGVKIKIFFEPATDKIRTAYVGQ